LSSNVNGDVNVNEQTWNEILRIFDEGTNRINVLFVDPVRAQNTVSSLQLNENSYIGAIARHSGGVLVDGGWIKLLGSGNNAVFGDLLSWNGFGNDIGITLLHGACIIAYDLAGLFCPGYIRVGGYGIVLLRFL